MERVAGPYTVFRLTKRNFTTADAVRLVAERLGVPRSAVGVAGLKDKFAVTMQYLTAKGDHKGFSTAHVTLERIGFNKRAITTGDLLGNRFTIRLHGIECPFTQPRDVPNFFGDQRFGKDRKNSLIGKLLLQRTYEQACTLANVHTLPDKARLKFFIHAYQSLLFNSTLEQYRKNHTLRGKRGDILGYDSRPTNRAFFSFSHTLLTEDTLSLASFRFDDLRLMCRGSVRDLAITPQDFSSRKERDTTVVEFFLPKGCYGTVIVDFLLRLTKDQR